jgi:transposase
MEYAPREYELLQTIPGVGKRLAGAILGILSPLTRFESSKELSSFLGLAPQIDQSGKRKEGFRVRGGIPFCGSSSTLLPSVLLGLTGSVSSSMNVW